MGQLIMGDPRSEKLYSMEEISLATGIKKSTLRSRREKLGYEATRTGYTYAQIIQMMQRPKPHNAPKMRNVEELKERLKKDGYGK